ncbi:riboflavin synthase [Salicibibacter halophilus]|uniref:Riboflavin synthase n=1 Tax=Salicibibacter halophilus TaxID=2502791 RepID=A0A514LIY2_9BACI|nr:riboflavin synthase [Salicibibacter halophilus]QDI91803.1 riboflavin synthase [Salicibibacter halophilus]
MFTGLIEEVGVVKDIVRTGQKGLVTIHCAHVLEDARIGDSIAVNGVCLTVTSIQGAQFTADIMKETFASSTLSQLRHNDPVNLERSMAAADRFGGHIVAGHTDGVGEIIQRTTESESVNFQIKVEGGLLRYIVQKGSVAVDGISLTVAHEHADSFIVAIIPHTLAETNLGSKSVGDHVNIETDIIGKYVEKLLQPANDQPEQTIDALLEKNGFYERREG